MKVIFTLLLTMLGFSVEAHGQSSNNSCPKISILTPSTLMIPGESAEFRAFVNGLEGINKYEYFWTVSIGNIKQGQGTSRLDVITTKENSGANVSVSLRVKGFEAECPNEASEVAAVESLPIIDYFNNYGPLSKEKMRYIVDDFFIQLNNNPEFQGVIVFDFDNHESRKDKLARLRLIFDTIRFRHYNPTRISIAIANNPSHLKYTFWAVKTAADVPGGLDNHILLKGGELIKDLGIAFPVPKKK